MWWMLLLSFAALAQDEIDLKAVRKFERGLPDYDVAPKTEEYATSENLYRIPKFPVKFKEIKDSGHELGAVRAGNNLIRLEDNTPLKLTKDLYLNFYRMEDEEGFKYLVNKDGTTTYRIHGDHVSSLKQTTEMYVPPTKYSTLKAEIIEPEYEGKLHIKPEVAFYTGVVSGQYMRDLFNDSQASKGQTNQIGLNFFTDWAFPVRVGLATHFEFTKYKLSTGGTADYSSISLGPQFKTKDLDFFFFPLRFQTQFRISPLSQLKSPTSDFKFNSVDVLTSIEAPIENRFGEFVLGLFYQAQWLNIRDQKDNVQVNSSNAINSGLGLSLGQVF